MWATIPRRIRLIFLTPLVLSVVVLRGNASGETLTYTATTSAAEVHLRSNGEIVIDRGAQPSPRTFEYYTLADPGSPAVPYRVFHILLPKGAEFAGFDAVSERQIEIPGSFRPRAAATPRDPDAAPAVELPQLAGPLAGGPFPQQLARYLGTGYWHGHAIAGFAVFPVQIDGDRVQVHERITLSIRTRTPDAPRDVVVPLRVDRERIEAVQSQISSLVVNPRRLGDYDLAATEKPSGPFAPTSAPSLEGSPVDYLIVTTEALASAYQRLADWKTAKGVPTVVRTLEWIDANHRHGVDIQETLRFFIRDAYQKWGIRWVLLGGDTPEIPARYCYNTYYYGGRYLPVDLYYAGLDGSWNDDHDDVWGETITSGGFDNADLYAEVYAGRLPTSSVADVNILIDKIFNYETPVDPSYTDKMMFLAEVLFPYPWDPGDPIDVNGANISETLLLGTPSISTMDIVRAYETYDLFPGSIPESRQQTIDSLNAGFNLVFHIGHGYRFNMHVADANLVIADADALYNQNRYCNPYLLNCTAVAFDYDCLGEHFLKNQNGGAVSIVGASESAFPDASANYMNEYARLLFDVHAVNIGETFARSRLPRTALAQLSDNPDRWTHFIYTLLADPEMPLWTGPVDSLQVTHVSSVGMGMNPIQVDVSSLGSPAESVLVCLWKDTDDYQQGWTNAAGSVVLDFTCESPGSLSVVATGLNKRRYQGWIQVVQESGPYLNLANVAFNDTVSVSIVGNGDGVIDAGEEIDVVPELSNTGGAASNWTVLTLRCDDPHVTVTDSVSVVDPIPPGETGTALDVWHVVLSPTAPDESVADFEVVSSEMGGGDWHDSFSRLIHAPVLEFTTLRRDDSPPLGNGNGTIETDEEFRLYCAVKNYGSGAAVGLTGNITDLGTGFDFVDSNDVYPDVLPMIAAENVVGWRLSENNVTIENFLEIVVTDAYGRALVDTLEFREPLAPSNLSFDTSLGEDRIHIWWDLSTTPDVDRYNVYRSTTPGGPYSQASIDLVDHASFTDAGLAPSTRYYYVVTAVDECGNESTPSPEASATTTPPLMSGWPNALPAESSNSPAIGDIDGDGDLELVVGNDKLYAWHHDGTEVRDGDSNLQTWGVFSDQGEDYVGPAALARLDATPGLDIVAATYTSMEVFCFRYDGTVLPGWPKSTFNKVRAAVAVGDLDGDNDFEIVSIDEDAIMYAWHHDGNEVRDGDGDPGTDGVFYRFPDRLWWQYQAPALCDVDDDGADEIIIGTQDSTLYVLNGDGSDVPGWPVFIEDFAGGGVAVGDVDNDGALEIVCTVKNASRVRLYELDGTLVWSRWAQQNLFFNPSPALGDLDGDGTLEIFYPASSGRLYAFKADGTQLPGWPVFYSTTTYTESSPVIADVSGDGNPDVILGDESKLINAWDAAGNLLDGFPLSTQNAIRGTPTVTDFDGDGDVDIVAVSFDRSVYAWDYAAPYDTDASPWPEYHANSHRNCHIGFVVPTSVSDDDDVPPLRAGLEQNVPNPFNPVTNIVFHVPTGTVGRVTLMVYDVTGARVRTLADGHIAPGRHARRWDGTDDRGNRVGSGVYFYHLSMPGFADTKKMVLLK